MLCKSCRSAANSLHSVFTHSSFTEDLRLFFCLFTYSLAQSVLCVARSHALTTYLYPERQRCAAQHRTAHHPFSALHCVAVNVVSHMTLLPNSCIFVLQINKSYSQRLPGVSMQTKTLLYVLLHIASAACSI